MQSTQCMARGLSDQKEELRKNYNKKEEALHKTIERANESEEEAARLRQKVAKLEQTLGICKRRIVEQNEYNAHLLEKVRLSFF